MDTEINVKEKVLAVDDEEQIRNFIKNVLSEFNYEVFLASNGTDALKIVKDVSPDIILLDIQMPGINGIEVTKELKQNEDTKIIPIVILSSFNDVSFRVEALEAGADDFLSKPPALQELITRIKTLIQIKKYNDYLINHQKELQDQIEINTKQIKDAFLETMYRLSRAAEFRDDESGNHIKRVSLLSASLYQKLGKPESEIEGVQYASMMHDIGKIGLPDTILLKSDKLNEKEWALMKLHPIIGGKILEASRSKFLQLGEIIAHTHHEKWDGSGYPKGLRNNEIPLLGRVVTIVDVFDALTSKRPYRKIPFTIEKAFDIMNKGKGKHFDPGIVDKFLSMRREIVTIQKEYNDEGKSWLLQINP